MIEKIKRCGGSKFLFICLAITLVFTPGAVNAENEYPNTWFDQELPGLNPVLIDPDIYSVAGFRPHGFLALSPDKKEIYWPVIPPRVLIVSYENNSWTQPSAAFFSEMNIQAPSFSVDGNKLFFQMSDPQGNGSLDIWYVEKSATGFGGKRNLGSPPNSGQMESQPTITASGTVYFTGYYEKGLMNRGIFRTEYTEGQYRMPELLPESINTEYLDYMPFIAPDESFLLFSSTRPSGYENDIRLYVSFRTDDGNWTEPENLNYLMNFDYPSLFPCLTPDADFLIFLSSGKYYWVSSDILDLCRFRKVNR